MANTQALNISDFEAEDRPLLKPAQVPPQNLLAFAKQNGLRVTSGYSHGGHNPGSAHYRGSATDPGAIDIANQGVDLANLQRLASEAGYTVRDERSHPAGQARWTGPHYHLQKGGQPPKRELPTTQSAHAATPSLSPVAPYDVSGLMKPGLQYDQAGNLVRTPTKTRDIGSEIQRSLKPLQSSQQKLLDKPKIQESTGGVSLSDLDLDANDLAEVQAMFGRLKTKTAPKAETAMAPAPKTNFYGDIYQHALNAASGYNLDDAIQQSGHGLGAGIGDIAGSLVPILGGSFAGGVIGNAPGALIGGILGAGAAGTEQTLQAQRLAKQKKDIGQALSMGAVQAGLQAIPVVGQSAPVLRRVLTNAALQGAGGGVASGVQQAIEQGTITPKINWDEVRQNAAIGAAGGGVGAALHKPATREVGQKGPPGGDGGPYGFVDRNGKEIIRMGPDYQGPQHGFVNRQGQEINPRLTPQEQALVDTAPTAEAVGSPQRVRELTAGFQERTRPTETPQVIDPRNRPIPKELGPIKTETTDSGVEIATNAGKREIPQVETATAVGGEPVAPTPIREVSSILDAQGRPITTEQRPLMSGRDKALLRAEEISTRGDAPEPSSRPDIQPAGLQRPVPREISPILDRSGQPVDAGSTPTAPRALELPSQPKPTNEPLITPKPFAQRVREVGEPVAPSKLTMSQSATQPGAFTDTVNELLKDSGLDLEGVRKLKADMETRRTLLNTTLKGSKTAEASRLRTELKDLKERWKGVSPEVKDIVGLDFDPQTGMGKQKVDPNAVTAEQAAPYLTSDKGREILQQYAEAMRRGTRVRERYVGEQTGRSHEVAHAGKGGRVHVTPTEFSPTHFTVESRTYPNGSRQVVVAHGYNQRGHQAERYIELSPKGSHVQQVLAVTDKPAFRGPMANIAQGAGEFSVSDLLARGPRTERGFIKTSEAIRTIHEQKKAIREVMQQSTLPADTKQRLQSVLTGKDFSFDDIRKLRNVMNEPAKLAEFCSNMGLS